MKDSDLLALTTDRQFTAYSENKDDITLACEKYLKNLPLTEDDLHWLHVGASLASLELIRRKHALVEEENHFIGFSTKNKDGN